MSVSNRAIPKLRGNVKTTPQIRELFSYLKYYKEFDPEHGGKPRKKFYKGWHVEGAKADSKGVHDFTDLAKLFSVSDEQIRRIINFFPHGLAQEDTTRRTEPKFVQDYRKTECHSTILKSYADSALSGQTKVVGIDDKTGQQITEPYITGQGARIDKVGEELFYHFKQDPVTLTPEQFREAKNFDFFKDSKGNIKYYAISCLRIIMGFAGISLATGTSLAQEWATRGLKGKGQKKDDYLSEAEIIKFINNVEEIDTLVCFRMGMEGGGRFSATSIVEAKNFNWETYSISMRESKTDDNPERVFTDCSLAFFRQYMRDFQLSGRLFQRSPVYKVNYASFEKSIKKAAFNAGIWWYRIDPNPMRRGKTFEENGKTYRVDQKTGIVYQKVAYRSKGKTEHKWFPVEEGKDVGTHTSMKHTFVSIASLHGFSIGDCSQQTGTDIKTLKEYYHGTQLAAMMRLVRGDVRQEPWNEWIPRVLEPEYQKAYAKLKNLPNMSAGGRTANKGA